MDYKKFKEFLEFLDDTEKLGDFLWELSDEQRDDLYSIPIVMEFDLLP